MNNAAIFRDAALHTATVEHVLEIVAANLALTITGCHTAVNHYLHHGRVPDRGPGIGRRRDRQRLLPAAKRQKACFITAKAAGATTNAI